MGFLPSTEFDVTFNRRVKIRVNLNGPLGTANPWKT